MQSDVCMVLSPFPADSHPAAQNETGVPRAGSRSLLLRFSQCIVQYRVFFGVCSFAFLVASAVTAAFTCHLPDLSDPSADFVAIQTDWSANVQQFKALLSETRSYPWRAGSSLVRRHRRGPEQRMQLWSIRQPDRVTTLPLFKHQGRFTGYGSQEEQLNLCFGEHSSVIEASDLWTTYEGYGRLVMSLDQNPSLNAPFTDVDEVPSNFFTEPGAFASLCSFQSRIYELDIFKQECVHSMHQRPVRNTTSNQPHCCSAWSVPNMVAALLGRSSCSQIRDSELVEINQLLTSCLPAFRNNTLRRVCWDAYGSDPTLLCPLVTPASCLRSPLIPLILATSLPDAADWRWRTTLLQLPIRRADSLSLFLALEAAYRSGNLTSDLPVPVYIHGMYLHAYNELVSETIFRDTFWLVIGLGTLLVLLALGTGTVVIPIITLIGIGWSLLAAYGLYSRVLCIPHFPVLNLMAVVLAIGLGADDLLVYFQVWKTSLRRTPIASSMNGDLELATLSPWSKPRHSRSTGLNETRAECSKFCGNGCFSFHDPSTSSGASVLAVQLQFTLHHAIPSMALTSIATALGLLINFLSSIVAVQRFALFSLLIVLCNFVYVVLVAPIVFVLFSSLCIFSSNLTSCMANYFDTISSHFSNLVLRGRFFLSSLFLIAVTVCTYFLLFKRNFTIPSGGGKTSFLRSNHLFESFLNTFTNWFWMERNLHQISTLIPVHFVWGFQPEDDRSFWTFIHKQPVESARWIPDEKLNLTSTAAREWLFKFCDRRLRQLPYLFKSTDMNSQHYGLPALDLAHLNPYLDAPLWCPFGRFTNSLDNYMFAHACTNVSSRCCFGSSSPTIFSLSPWHFRLCLEEYTSFEHHILPREFQSGFRFPATHSGEPLGLIVSVLTNLSMLTSTHDELRRGVYDLSAWFLEALTTAPDHLRGGRLVLPTLGPFEVEKNVTEYVYWSILVAILLAALLVLLSTGTLCLAVIALVSLFACLVTTGMMLIIIDNWSLGIVEGLVLSLAAGLAIDPCLHLALSVKRAGGRCCDTGLGWTSRSVHTSMCMLNAAVTGSAGSTAIAGLCMIACHLLCYHQIGVFLCVLMTSSWLMCYVMFASNLASWFSIWELCRNRH
ncbi:hypothetical protein CRM22_001840 [Opisthorchis felineus]|uniref:SSD domain-containing protein n=1 Tax=Opisthorchis felineus TaxID=147828 RepID=A0A4S2M8S6_OPIFE|nr:hypothetical protein CRM22_001840 [Opisthorchis felineus]